MVAAPLILLRKRKIIYKLRQSGALSPDTARTPEEAGFLPGVFPVLLNSMIRRNMVGVTDDGRYYIKYYV